ncbi:hypothetical protein SNEBB_005175 [Seison nebaliae]|nr:hypothetical protein SNEBB_005175 [Seison nebaliae]
MNAWMDQEWTDEYLRWIPDDYGNLTTLRLPCRLVWLPDIVLYNSAEEYTTGYMQSHVMIKPNGTVFWPPIVKLRSTCKIDITYFPFDDQICHFKMGSWIYDGLKVNLSVRNQGIDLKNYVQNGEWQLIDNAVRWHEEVYPCCPEPYQDITFYVHLRRRTLYYTYNVIIPCILLSILTCLQFWLPPETGEKVTLGLTVLLAFSVFMLLIAESMPSTSEFVPLIGIYLTFVMTMTSASVVMAVFIINIHLRGNKHRPVSLWFRRLILGRLAPLLRVNIREHRNLTDSTSINSSKDEGINEETKFHKFSDNSYNYSLNKTRKSSINHIGSNDRPFKQHSQNIPLNEISKSFSTLNQLSVDRNLVNRRRESYKSHQLRTKWMQMCEELKAKQAQTERIENLQKILDESTMLLGDQKKFINVLIQQKHNHDSNCIIENCNICKYLSRSSKLNRLSVNVTQRTVSPQNPRKKCVEHQPSTNWKRVATAVNKGLFAHDSYVESENYKSKRSNKSSKDYQTDRNNSELMNYIGYQEAPIRMPSTTTIQVEDDNTYPNTYLTLSDKQLMTTDNNLRNNRNYAFIENQTHGKKEKIPLIKTTLIEQQILSTNDSSVTSSSNFKNSSYHSLKNSHTFNCWKTMSIGNCCYGRKMKREDFIREINGEETTHQWHDIAATIDRFLFWVYFISMWVSTFFLLVVKPLLNKLLYSDLNDIIEKRLSNLNRNEP